MAKRRGLGKNLGDLLSTDLTSLVQEQEPVAASAASGTVAKHGDLVYLPVEWIQRGKYQPRRDMDVAALEELALSIKTQGVLQPIIVRPIGDQRYEIIAGERRWRATQIAELDTIPALVKDVNDETTMALALIENIQRENLNPIEEAAAIQRLIDELDVTHQEVATALGKSRASVTNLLRLMSLNLEVRTMIEHGDLELGHAKVLLALEGSQQNQAARMIVAKNLSVRETERLVKNILSPVNQLNLQKSIDPDVRLLQDTLSEKLGAKVTVDHANSGKGKLTIHYNNLDELDGILDHLK